MSGNCVKTGNNVKYLSTITDIGVLEEKDGNLPCVGEFMNILYKKQLFTDVTFLPSKGQKHLSAHRTVLAAKCSFFKELLFGSNKNEATGMEMKVKISNLSFDVFSNIIEYFYTDEIDFTDDSMVMEVLTGAKQFQIQSLIERCEEYIKSIDLTANNVCSTLQISDAKNVEALKERCIQYIEESTFEAINSVDFDRSTYNTVHKICNLESFNLTSEVQLLDAIVRWINLQPSHTQSKQKTPLLSCVRFLTLTPRDFGDAMKKYQDFLDPKDALKIMIFLNGSRTENDECLPKWCNRNIIRRCCIEKMESRERFIPRYRKGKIAISLKPCFETEEVAKLELTSSLQMKCIQGAHQINAIKFSFDGPPVNENNRESVFISVFVIPNNFGFKRAFRVLSHERKFHFDPEIRVREGCLIKIQAVAKDMKRCRFLQFDAENSPQNQHFECTVGSQPKQNRLFFISEVEYRPQQRFQNKQDE